MSNSSFPNHHHEPNFSDLLSDLWQYRRSIMMGLFMGFVLAILFVMSARPHYQAHLLLIPASPMNGAETSSLLSDENIYALRFLAQRFGTSGASDFERFQTIFSGASVAKELLSDDRIKKGLQRDRTFVFSSARATMNSEELSDYLADRVKLEPISGSNVRRLVYFHEDPQFAKYMVAAIHNIADRLIRDNIRRDSEARISYLQKAIFETSNPEHRRALTTLLLEQERLKMLVSIDQPYAAAVIEPASSGAKPQWPDFYFITAAFMLVGAFLNFMIFSLKNSKRISEQENLKFKARPWHKSKTQNSNTRIDSSSKAAE
jgi:hypothetical protein